MATPGFGVAVAQALATAVARGPRCQAVAAAQATALAAGPGAAAFAAAMAAAGC